MWMNFIEIAVFTTTYGIEPLTAVLLDLGIQGLVIEDSADFEHFLNDTELYWDYVDESLMAKKSQETNVKFYLAENEQGVETLAAVRETLTRLKDDDPEGLLGRLEVSLLNVREEDWANNWKQYFKPFSVGKRLAVKPSWEEYQNPERRTVVEIDPASSFGTGQHHTTKLCLSFLDELVCGGEHVLDMGCGSGILAAAALLLGADEAVGVDIDLNAVHTAEENISKNGLEGKFKGYCGNAISDGGLRQKLGNDSYDIVAANIVADVIIGMCPYLRQFVKDSGVVLLSGIIAPRLGEVTGAVEQFFTIETINEANDWCALLCRPKV